MKAGACLAMVAGLLALCLAACGSGERTGGAGSTVVVTVGKEPISQGLLDYYARIRSGMPASELDAGLRGKLLTELEQLAAAAQVEGASADPATEQKLALDRLQVLAKASAHGAGIDTPPGEDELQKAYESYVRSLPAREYHVAHILVATENTANAVLVKVQAHGDFAALARTESADDSKARGGDLGWIAPGRLPAAFTDAVRALKPGQVTTKPVQTPYGWHVIKLIEARPAAAPPYEQVKAQLAVNLQQERYARFLEERLKAVVVR